MDLRIRGCLRLKPFRFSMKQVLLGKMGCSMLWVLWGCVWFQGTSYRQTPGLYFAVLRKSYWGLSLLRHRRTFWQLCCACLGICMGSWYSGSRSSDREGNLWGVKLLFFSIWLKLLRYWEAWIKHSIQLFAAEQLDGAASRQTSKSWMLLQMWCLHGHFYDTASS